MTLLKNLLLIGILISSFTACQQEELNLVDDFQTDSFNVQEAHNDYISKHGRDVIIEYTSLEELNRVFQDNGLQPITLEEIGMTQEEYDFAQENIQNGNIADLRCDDPLYQFLGDMNQNGSLSTSDVVLATRVKNGLDPMSIYSYRFSYISYYWSSDGITHGEIEIVDIEDAIKVILGDPCP